MMSTRLVVKRLQSTSRIQGTDSHHSIERELREITSISNLLYAYIAMVASVSTVKTNVNVFACIMGSKILDLNLGIKGCFK